MGEARRKRFAKDGTFQSLDSRFRQLGIPTNAPGFYDDPRFMAYEASDPNFLEKYAEWVVERPRDQDYEREVRSKIVRLAEIVEARLEREQVLGACLNASFMVSRMLERLGIWNFVLRGSMTIEASDGRSFKAAHFPAYDQIDHVGGITGHAWLVVPPFDIVDLTLRHQRSRGDDHQRASLSPRFVAAERAEVVLPRVEDCVCADAIYDDFRRTGRHDPRLHFKVLPGMERMSRFVPGRKVDLGPVSVRYFASAVAVHDLPLEE